MTIRLHLVLLGVLAAAGTPAFAQFGPSGQAGPGGDKALGLDPMESNYWRSRLKGSPAPLPPSYTTILPLPGPDPAFWRLEGLEEAHRKGSYKVFSFSEANATFYQFVLKEPSCNHFTSFEAIIVDANRSVLVVLTLNMPALRRLEVRGTAKEWEQVEKLLTQLVETDPVAAERLNARLAQIGQIILEVKDTPLTQPEFEDTLQSLERIRWLTGLRLKIGLPISNLSPMGSRFQEGVNDLRRLARVRYLKELELHLDAVAKVSLGFPAGLKALTIQEYVRSSDSLAHVRLPPRLRSLAVESDNPTTRDHFAALGGEARVADCRITPLPHSWWVESQAKRQQSMMFAGVWSRSPASGRPAARIEMTATGIHPQGDTLVPGYEIRSAGVLDIQHALGSFYVVAEYSDQESEVSPTGTSVRFKTILKGKAIFKGQAEKDRLTLTAVPPDAADVWIRYGTQPFGDSIIARPDDGTFRKAAIRALEGEWRREHGTAAAPPTTELGPEEEKEAPAADEPSSPVATSIPTTFCLTGVAGILAAAAGIGLFAWWRVRKGRRVADKERS